jgi:hypothetical protein
MTCAWGQNIANPVHSITRANASDGSLQSGFLVHEIQNERTISIRYPAKALTIN